MIPAISGAIIGNVGMVYAPQFSSRWVCLIGGSFFLLVLGCADFCLQYVFIPYVTFGTSCFCTLLCYDESRSYRT
jgi:hypothetical protein